MYNRGVKYKKWTNKVLFLYKPMHLVHNTTAFITDHFMELDRQVSCAGSKCYSI